MLRYGKGMIEAGIIPNTAEAVESVLREALARSDVDAVSIILPFGLNRRVTEDAVAAGKHVMLEKPIAVITWQNTMM